MKRQCRPKDIYTTELVLVETYDGEEASVQSVGVPLYITTTGYYYFRGRTMKEIEKMTSMWTYV